MKVLIACEFSGIVRDAFAAKGHDAWSCDLLPTERPGQHIKGDITTLITNMYYRWDLLIAHPPCDYLTVSNNNAMTHGCNKYTVQEGQKLRKDAIKFFMRFAICRIPKIAIENPIGIMSTRYRKPDQIIQPWQFGHGETKATCLWLQGLPLLKPTNIVEGREGKIWKMTPSLNRAKDRSRTYEGIAKAMAAQWG